MDKDWKGSRLVQKKSEHDFEGFDHMKEFDWYRDGEYSDNSNERRVSVGLKGSFQRGFDQRGTGSERRVLCRHGGDG